MAFLRCIPEGSMHRVHVVLPVSSAIVLKSYSIKIRVGMVEEMRSVLLSINMNARK